MNDRAFDQALRMASWHPTPVEIRGAIFDAIDAEDRRRAAAGEPLIDVGVYRVIRMGIAQAVADHDRRTNA